MTNETTWSVDQAHSEIAFKVRHLMISNVKGEFKIFDASIYTTGKDFTTAEIDLWIDVSSIDTGDEKRNEHLKSADFFDAEKFKQIAFKSSTMSKATSGDNYELWGELTIKGVTKDQKLNVQFGGIVKDPYGNEKAGFTITGILNRSDWGLNSNTMMEAGGMVIGDAITISCELELTNAGPKELVMELEPTAARKGGL